MTSVLISDAHTKYEPLRNLMRNFNAEESLPIIWQLSRHLAGTLPHQIVGCPYRHLREKIFPFQLGLLCRELFLHGTEQAAGRTLSRWSDLAAALNAISAYSETVSDVTPDNVQLELHRIAQQQLPLQKRLTVSRFMRYLQIYEHARVAPFLESVMNMSVRDYSFLCFMTFTQISKQPWFVTSLDLKKLRIADSARDSFFGRMSAHCSVVRDAFQEAQRFDHTWQYTFNFLDDRPLIGFDPIRPDRVYCPGPERAMNRFTEGVFYLLLGQTGFGNAFGHAFEDYIGKVLVKACRSKQLAVHREQPFNVGKNVNHGVDFVLSDATGNVFVECKAKRLALRGRVASKQQDLDAELDVLASAVVQNYRNIRLAMDGRTHWTRNALPSMNLVVTLADWNLISPQAYFDLDAKIAAQLEEKGLLGMQSEIPYSILSAESFEVFGCAIDSASINEVIGPAFGVRGGEWQLGGQLQSRYPEAIRLAEQLFRDEFDAYGRSISVPDDL